MEIEIKKHTSDNPIYGVGFIGALVYFLSQACCFWSGVTGILKAVVWPAFLVYEAFSHLYMTAG